RPTLRVRVWAAVLARAANVARDVAGRGPGSIERRIEQLHEARVGVHEAAVDGVHRLPGAIIRRGAGEDGPALRDRVDPAFGIARRAERRAVVEPGAPVPGAVPARRLDAPAKRRRLA